ncbi:TolC family protein [Clostridiaceae bacterium HSG29]|nr:TolC family protein [Clostridiaceae bacterium HSG29]
MKKIISVIMIISMFLSLSVVFADELNVNLSYDDVLELSLENSNGLDTIEQRILLAERYLKSANSKSDSVKTSGLSSDSKYLENGIAKELTPSQKNRILIDLNESKLDMVEDLKIDTLEKYNDVLNKKESIMFKNQDLITAKKEYEQKTIQYDLGMITTNQLFEYEINVKNLEIEISNLERNYSKALIEVNRLIGYPIGTELNLKTKVDISIEDLNYNLDEITEKAIVNSNTVRTSYNNYLLKNLEKTVVSRYSRYEKPDSYDDLEEEVIDLLEAYEDSKITEEVNIYTDYYNLQNSYADVEIAKLNLELIKKSMEIEKLKFDNEMSTYLDYKKAVDSYRTSYNNLSDKELILYKAKVQFDYYIEKLDYEFENVIIK